MARPPSRYHPFHTIREVFAETFGPKAGTQEFLALMLGSPKAAITIKRVEAGSLKLSRNLASLITAATGVDTLRILKGDLTPPRTVEGKEFTTHTFAEWNKTLTKELVERLCTSISAELRAVLLRAFSEGASQHLRKAYCQLSSAIGEQHVDLLSRRGVQPEETIETMLPGIQILRQCNEEGSPFREVCMNLGEIYQYSLATNDEEEPEPPAVTDKKKPKANRVQSRGKK